MLPFQYHAIRSKQLLNCNVIAKHIKRNESDVGNDGGSTYQDGIEGNNQKSNRILRNDKLNCKNNGDSLSPATISGMDFIRNPRLFRGLGFTIEERQALGIHGLLPPHVRSLKEQTENSLQWVRNYNKPLNKYNYLLDLKDRNERLFYKLMSENVEELLPIIYTPTVGDACHTFGYSFRKPHGLFITIHDKGHIAEVLKNWPENNIKAIVVTDGERILGLGDYGVQGMAIPVGKLALYTVLAGIKPWQCLPITLDVGTNREGFLVDPDYVGIRKKRVQGREYDEFIDEFMESVVKRYGQDTLIQFEDFGNHNAFRLLEKYKDKYCTFNDDIQGTAAVVVAGVIAAVKATNTRLSDQIYLFQGAGEANIGIAKLLQKAMCKREGVSLEEANKSLWMTDSKGLLIKGREGITEEKEPFAHEYSGNELKDLGKIVRELSPSVLIGAASVPNAFTEQIIKDMAKKNDNPIIFALSNPTSKAECTAEQVYKFSDGRALFASGSPFPSYEMNGKKFEPGQANNAYIFPGVALGAISCGLHHIDDDVFLAAAECLSEMLTEEDKELGRLYPPIYKIKDCSVKIAANISEIAYKHCVASVYPEPKDKIAFIRQQLYDYDYDEWSPLPVTYSYPSEENEYKVTYKNKVQLD